MMRTDDLTGEPDAETVLVTVNGRGIEVDLAAKSAARLVEALEPFWTVGTESEYDVTRRERRRQRAPQNPAQRAPQSPSDYEPPSPGEAAEIRAWARERGVSVPDRGRVPRAVVEQYRKR